MNGYDDKGNKGKKGSRLTKWTKRGHILVTIKAGRVPRRPLIWSRDRGGVQTSKLTPGWCSLWQSGCVLWIVSVPLWMPLNDMSVWFGNSWESAKANGLVDSGCDWEVQNVDNGVGLAGDPVFVDGLRVIRKHMARICCRAIPVGKWMDSGCQSNGFKEGSEK